jgi:enoyl-[acyl-carrier protein] reductase III
MSEGRFANKVVLVTGSGRGIGKAIAKRFAMEGASVALNYFRNRSAAEATAAEFLEQGLKSHVVIRADVGKLEDIDRLIEETVEHFGGLDILVHNAASGYNRPVMEQRIKGWDWTMNINARSALFLAQRAAPIMEARGGGAIVTISSIGSTRVLPDYVVVGASKAALEAVTRYLAVELAPMRIAVNAVSAGGVETEALQHFLRDNYDERVEDTIKRAPAQQMVTADDIAGVVLFLSTPEAFMIRGQTILVDGGATLRY